MKKQIVFVLTELYGNDSDTEVNVLGVYSTKTEAKEKLAEKKQNVLESYEQAFCGEYDVSEDHPTLFEITHKKEFIFVFPQSGETITKEMNPLAVKDAAIKYLKTQNEVRGDICIIKDSKENVIAMGYVSDNMKISFFTEDETVNDIKPIGVIEEGGKQ